MVMPAFVGQWKQSLVDAIKHSDCALAMDPENEKGYLRRGCARSKLCEAAEYQGGQFKTLKKLGILGVFLGFWIKY